MGSGFKLMLPGCIILGKLVNLSEPWFLISTMGTVVVVPYHKAVIRIKEMMPGITWTQ